MAAKKGENGNFVVDDAVNENTPLQVVDPVNHPFIDEEQMNYFTHHV